MDILNKAETHTLDFELTPQTTKAISYETKSRTVENLISQNEDLSARLKVYIRRLAQLEDQNQKLQIDLNKLEKIKSFEQDKFDVLLEKETQWRGQINELNLKINQLNFQISKNEEKIRTLENVHQRFLDYQEKVKTTIKPRLVELKSFAEQLKIENTNLISQNEIKSSEVIELKNKINQITAQAKNEVEKVENKLCEMIDSYEKTISINEKQIYSLKSRNEELETQYQLFQHAQKTCDRYENELIELRRFVEDKQLELKNAVNKEKLTVDQLMSENTVIKIENSDMKNKILEDFKKLETLEKDKINLVHQLDSLRILHSVKTDENEKLKLSLSALEKLNLELSLRLQEYHQKQMTPQS